MKILIVEDDATIVFALRKFCESKNWSCETAYTVSEAKRKISSDIDLFMLDIGLPDGSGFEVCHLIRKEFQTPILFLTAQDDEQSLVQAYDLGADEYLSKPFRLSELDRRIQVLLKRQKQTMIDIEVLKINVLTAMVYVNEEEIILSVQEYRLLLVLAQHVNQIMTRQSLSRHIWGDEDYISDNTLSVNIKRLREKLGQSVSIITIHGEGYCLEV
ncbi:response regulator transcription factor [Erysipelothrix urinaevulpis]|uniref:response regulator transcription factor n=1 Tax=Erysipelothrix urinaevulpis TaxID=2683717 RepID=UPI001356DA77|nr:response regulator transcription factor [Erysipelothrix urinaevulpis]